MDGLKDVYTYTFIADCSGTLPLLVLIDRSISSQLFLLSDWIVSKMNFFTIILLITCSVVYAIAFTDPSITNPQLMKRFEYKLSFKGPHLAFKDGTVPFWKFGGSEFDRFIR